MSDPAIGARLNSALDQLLGSQPLPEPATTSVPRSGAHRLATAVVGGHDNQDSQRDHADEREWVVQPTHIEVSSEAWRAIKAMAVVTRAPLGWLIGYAVERALQTGLDEPSFVERVVERGGEARDRAGRRGRQFARLQLISASVWTAFRVLAVDAAVTTARAVGIAIEQLIEARRADAKVER